jgi:hypothetical protein
MKLFYILFIGLFMCSGLINGMHAEDKQFRVSLRQRARNDEIEIKMENAKIQANSKRRRGYSMGVLGFIISFEVAALCYKNFNKNFGEKPTIIVPSLYTLVAASTVCYSLNSIFCKVYRNKTNNTFEVHGLCTRIKNKMVQFFNK